MDSKEQQRKQEAYLKQIEQDYKAVFGSNAGKRVLEDLKAHAFWYTSTFNAESPEQTFINEGMRAAVLHIDTMVTKPIDDIKELMGMSTIDEEKEAT